MKLATAALLSGDTDVQTILSLLDLPSDAAECVRTITDPLNKVINCHNSLGDGISAWHVIAWSSTHRVSVSYDLSTGIHAEFIQLHWVAYAGHYSAVYSCGSDEENEVLFSSGLCRDGTGTYTQSTITMPMETLPVHGIISTGTQ